MATYIFVAIFVLFTTTSRACPQFIVGGNDGWRLNPSEDYNHWSKRVRFQVNDTLLFKFNKGSDSVLVVKKDDYSQCNTANPISIMDDGNSTFKLDRSGPFFFISGNKSSCHHGQKLALVVLAVRSNSSHPPSSSPTDSWAPDSSPSESPGARYSPPSGNDSSTPGGGSSSSDTQHRSIATTAAWCSSAALVSTVTLFISVCLS